MIIKELGSMANQLKTRAIAHTAIHSKTPVTKWTPLTRHFSELLTLLILAILILPLSVSADFTASVDKTIIASHETIELTLRTDTNTSSAPNFKVLEWSFHIVGTRQSRKIRTTNGRSEWLRNWVVTLMPKQIGVAVIPPMSLDNERSEPITIDVKKDINTRYNNNYNPVFMKAVVSSESVYVQQEVVLTLQILYQVPLYDEKRLSALEIDDAIIKQLGDTKKYDTIIDGTRHKVFELKYAIHPQKAGWTEIPSLTFQGLMADNRDPFSGMFSNVGQPVSAQSPSLFIEVKPQLKSYPNKTWLPARNLNISEIWSQSLDNLKVGDAITRTITVEADGLSAAQLPPLLMPQPKGVNSYPDHSSTNDIANSNGIKGQRTDSIAMIPTEPGTITLPAVNITWLDTASEEIKVASIPERIITVQPADTQQQLSESVANSQSNAESSMESSPGLTPCDQQENTTSNTLWQLLTALFAMLWLASTFLWWMARPSSASSDSHESLPKGAGTVKPKNATTSEPKAFANFESACKEGDIKEALEQLKTWSHIYLKDNTMTTLAQCLDQLGSDDLKLLCHELNRSLYSGQSDPVELSTMVNVCRALRKGKSSENKHYKLNDIYPSKD